MNEDAFCDAVMSGATCSGARCVKACADASGQPDDSLCTNLQTVNGACVAPQLVGGACSPQNNACNAVKAAEIWEPSCGEWTALGEQEKPRMYHSTALLLPDGRVISMGGGHADTGWILLEEQKTAEYFEPNYGPSGSPVPAVTAPSSLTYGSEIEVTVENEVDIARATLVRLGATTHGFDMSQRFIELAPPSGSGSQWTVFAPRDQDEAPFHLAQNIAPPGYYMLFLISADGVPSIGSYIKLGPNTSSDFTCEASSMLTAYETACATEPQAGVCPSGSEVTQAVALPTVQGPNGVVAGFSVHVPIDVLHDPTAPRQEELASVEAMCVSACEAYFADVPGTTANCASAGAFSRLDPFAAGQPSLDLVPQSSRHGEGLFPAQQLTCDLGIDCYGDFDEHLARTVPARTTPGGSMISVGEEVRIALGTSSDIEFVTNMGTYTTRLTGSVGYSECSSGHASAPCAFYLGSLEALAASSVTMDLMCDDGQRDRKTLKNLVVRLTQPAFGVAEQGAGRAKAFPPGALVVETAFTVGGEYYETSRANRLAATITAEGGEFDVGPLLATMEVPCREGTATVTARLVLSDPGDGSLLAAPPTARIDTPSIVTCGQPTQLLADVNDPDGDLDEVRWYVDGVLVDDAQTSLVFTGPHTLEVVARDVRGAATSDRKEIQCN